MTKAPVSLPRAGAFAFAGPPAALLAGLMTCALAGLATGGAHAADAATASGPSLVLRGDTPPALAGGKQQAPTRATLDAARERLAERAWSGLELDRVVVEGFGDRRSPEDKLRERLNTPDRPFRSLADRNGGLRGDRDSFGLRNDCIAAQGPFACRESAAIGRKSKEHWMDGR